MQPLWLFTFPLESVIAWICIYTVSCVYVRWRSRWLQDWNLTVDNDFDDPEVDFTPGHDAGLAGVVTLICLLDATDLEVVAAQDLEADCGWESEGEREYKMRR